MMWKVFCLSLAALAAVPSAFAELIAYDGFESYADGPLAGLAGGSGFAADWVAESVAQVVSGGFMSYHGGEISVNGGSVHLRYGKSSRASVFSRKINTTTYPTDGSPLYMSFLMRVSESCVQKGDRDYSMLAFSYDASKAPSFGSMFACGADASAEGNGFGVRSISNVYATQAAESDRTYFVVVKWAKNGSSHYRYVSTIVNPTTLAEPEMADWDIADNDSKNTSHTPPYYAYLECFVKYDSSDQEKCEAEDVFEIDEFRLGTTWADVTGPVSYGGILPRPAVSIEVAENGNRIVTVESSQSDVLIRYTVDGSEPSASVGAIYSAPITVTSPTVFRFVAVSADGAVSETVPVNCFFDACWVGGGADKSWSTVENWNPAVNPSRYVVIFNSTNRTAEKTVNSIVSSDMTVGSILFANSNQSVAKSGYSWHHVSIADGATLTVSGADAEGRSVALRYPTPPSGDYEVPVTLSGNGRLVVDSPESEFALSSVSRGGRALAKLYCDQLGGLEINVKSLRLGSGSRSNADMRLPIGSSDESPCRLTAEEILLGDSNGGGETYGSNAKGQSILSLGARNEFRADRIFIGAGSGLPKINVLGGKVQFNSAIASGAGKLSIRAKDGAGRADLYLGSHGNADSSSAMIRRVLAELLAENQVIDARLGTLVVGVGRQGQTSSSSGSVTATLALGTGSVDAQVFTNGLTVGKGDLRADFTRATTSVKGGEFTVAEPVVLGMNAAGGGNIKSQFTLDGGLARFAKGAVLAEHRGSASNVTSVVTVSAGTLDVIGDLASGRVGSSSVSTDGKTYAASVTAEVDALGGVLAVTNAVGTAELRIESGALVLGGGKVLADNLVLTNELSALAVTIGTAAIEPVVVSGAARFGGTIRATITEDAQPKHGSRWMLVSGAASRIGTFAAEDLPVGFKVVYTADGVFLDYPGRGTVLFVR